MILTSSQRKYLRSLAHHIKPSVYIGKNDLTQGAIASINDSLNAHELIKIKFHNNKITKSDISMLEKELKCSITGNIGKTAIIFRQNEDKDLQKIKLPK